MELTDEYEELVLVSLKVNEHSLGKELLPLIQILQRLYATFRTSIIIVEYPKTDSALLALSALLVSEDPESSGPGPIPSSA